MNRRHNSFFIAAMIWIGIFLFDTLTAGSVSTDRVMEFTRDSEARSFIAVETIREDTDGAAALRLDNHTYIRAEWR